MPNIPKPELERGNYITYADEPGTVYEPDSGGGGTTYLIANNVDDLIVPEFSFKDVKDAIDDGNSVFVKISTTTFDEDTQSNEETLSLMRVYELDWSDSLSNYGVVVAYGPDTLGFASSSQDETMHFQINP